MLAAFMLLQAHGWGIHAVRTGRRRGPPGAVVGRERTDTTGHSQPDATRSRSQLCKHPEVS